MLGVVHAEKLNVATCFHGLFLPREGASLYGFAMGWMRDLPGRDWLFVDSRRIPWLACHSPLICRVPLPDGCSRYVLLHTYDSNRKRRVHFTSCQS